MQASCHGFVVNALGLVALLIELTEEWEESPSLLVGLDPDSGAARWDERWEAKDVDQALPTLLGDLVVADDDDGDSAASLLDVTTGVERQVLPNGNVCVVDGDLMLIRRRERVRALSWPDGHDDLWIIDGAPPGGWIAAGQVVVAPHSAGPVALDRSNGSKRWSEPSSSPVMGDARGVLLGAARRGRIRPADGSDATSVDFALEPTETPAVLFPDRLLTIVERRERRRPVQTLYTHDRITGARRMIAEIPLDDDQAGAAWVAAREVIYHGHDEEVEAFGAGGERLWSLSVRGEQVTQLAPYPRRLYVATDCSILCLEEGGAPG